MDFLRLVPFIIVLELSWAAMLSVAVFFFRPRLSILLSRPTLDFEARFLSVPFLPGRLMVVVGVVVVHVELYSLLKKRVIFVLLQLPLVDPFVPAFLGDLTAESLSFIEYGK